jgi:hypothetical protein
MDIFIVKQYLPADLHTVNEVVKAIETAEQRGLATS